MSVISHHFDSQPRLLCVEKLKCRSVSALFRLRNTERDARDWIAYKRRSMRHSYSYEKTFDISIYRNFRHDIHDSGKKITRCYICWLSDNSVHHHDMIFNVDSCTCQVSTMYEVCTDDWRKVKLISNELMEQG